MKISRFLIIKLLTGMHNKQHINEVNLQIVFSANSLHTTVKDNSFLYLFCA